MADCNQWKPIDTVPSYRPIVIGAIKENILLWEYTLKKGMNSLWNSYHSNGCRIGEPTHWRQK